jgi:hypothetical protein
MNMHSAPNEGQADARVGEQIWRGDGSGLEGEVNADALSAGYEGNDGTRDFGFGTVEGGAPQIENLIDVSVLDQAMNDATQEVAEAEAAGEAILFSKTLQEFKNATDPEVKQNLFKQLQALRDVSKKFPKTLN